MGENPLFLITPSVGKDSTLNGPRSAAGGAPIEVFDNEVDPAERGSFGTGFLGPTRKKQSRWRGKKRLEVDGIGCKVGILRWLESLLECCDSGILHFQNVSGDAMAARGSLDINDLEEVVKMEIPRFCS